MNDEDNRSSEDNTSSLASETLNSRLKEAASAPPSLVLMFGPSRVIGRQWRLDKAEKVIGRSEDCDIYIDDKSVSRKHAQVVVKADRSVHIFDLESSNGTIVAGTKLGVQSVAILKDSDLIQLGSVVLKFLTH